VPRVRQVAYLVQRAHKPAALGRILDVEAPASAIVFCHTRVEVDELVEAIGARGYRAEGLHGGFAQEQRDRVMARFRARALDVLVATDVAARGLDVEHVSHVVNYDVPGDTESYVHRIGRTGRAGREGVAITLVEPRRQWLLRNIERAVAQPIAVAAVPTVADLRDRRLQRTRDALRAAVQAGGLDAFRQMVAGLAGECDLLDVAAAAASLVHAASRRDGGAGDDVEIPDAEPFEARRRTRVARDRGAGDDARGEAGGRPWQRRPSRAEQQWPAGAAGQGGGRGGRGEPGRPRGPAGGGRARLYVGIGRSAGLRPGDLVGAIANEAGVRGELIGPIEIAEDFALVGVPNDAAGHVVTALRRTKIRGRRAVVRRDGNRGDRDGDPGDADAAQGAGDAGPGAG
jgi:ATP-dependent RNA helicase DeaD